jgi:ketosteroid isomerase-like protein
MQRNALIPNEHEMNELADRLTGAYARNDIGTIVACYAPDARIWHNFDEVEQTVNEQLAATQWLHETLKNLAYEIKSRRFFDGGYVQQYVVHGTIIKGGAVFRMPLCMTVTVRDGRILRLDEYLDSAHLKPLQDA